MFSNKKSDRLLRLNENLECIYPFFEEFGIVDRLDRVRNLFNLIESDCLIYECFGWLVDLFSKVLIVQKSYRFYREL